MLFNKNRVEEDLERIRVANLPEGELLKENEKTKKKSELQLEKNDLLAMILAIMSLILPYVFAFIGIMAVVIFIMSLLF